MRHLTTIILSSFTAFIVGAVLLVPTTEASLEERLRGHILLDVEQNGEAWYVHPNTQKRRYLGRPADAFDVMRFKGLGITDADLRRIPQEDDDKEETYEQVLRERLAGQIVLQVEQSGEAWYIDPRTKTRFSLGRPEEAFAIMRERGLGITSEKLRTIPLEKDLTPLNSEARFDSYVFGTDRGVFPIELVTIPKETYRMITDTADEGNCGANCPAQSLRSYAREHGAQIGITGSYFCEAGAAECVGQENRFSSPVYNSGAQKMINEGELATHVGPMLLLDGKHRYRYFHRAREMGSSVRAFEKKHKTKVKAALSNYPSLVEDSEVIVEGEPLDTGMRSYRLTRSVIGMTDDRLFLAVIRRATVIDAAHVMQALGAKDVLNLDGGASTALYYDRAYVYGPGRNLPNVILFKRR